MLGKEALPFGWPLGPADGTGQSRQSVWRRESPFPSYRGGWVWSLEGGQGGRFKGIVHDPVASKGKRRHYK